MFEELGNFGSNIAVIDQTSRKISYLELIEIGDTWFKNKIKPRSLILMNCDYSLETLSLYVYCIRNKVVPLMLPSNSQQEYLNDLINNYKPSYIWLPKNNKEIKIPDAKIKSEFKENILLQTSNYIDMVDDLAILLTTSGSTGNPSVVRLSYENLDSNTNSIIDTLKINEEDSVITSLPLSYSYGLSIVNTHLSSGSGIVLNEDSLTEKSFWGKIEKHQVTTLNGVPFHYETLSRFKPQYFKKTSLKKMTQAGGKLNSSITSRMIQICRENSIEFYKMYGQTEATARMSILKSEFLNAKPDSIGHAIPGGKFFIIDENGEEITNPNSEGTLIYTGPNVSLGYAQNYLDLNKKDENKQVLNTGDISYFDKEGFYFITGRQKRFIKIFGVRVNLDDIEQDCIASGLNCVLIQKNDKLIVCNTNINQELEICEFLKTKYRISPDNIDYLIVSQFPRNHNGKIDYQLISKKYEEKFGSSNEF